MRHQGGYSVAQARNQVTHSPTTLAPCVRTNAGDALLTGALRGSTLRLHLKSYFAHFFVKIFMSPRRKTRMSLASHASHARPCAPTHGSRVALGRRRCQWCARSSRAIAGSSCRLPSCLTRVCDARARENQPRWSDFPAVLGAHALSRSRARLSPLPRTSTCAARRLARRRARPRHARRPACARRSYHGSNS